MDAASTRKPYPTDLSDEQWAVLEPLIPPAKHGGSLRTVNMREVMNTLFYLNRTGCQWRMLPHDLLPKSTVYDYFRQWRQDGTWQRFVDALRQRVRQEGVYDHPREPSPSAASLDSQSVKTTEMGGERGYDGGKKITGRKRHLCVDTLGLLLVVVVTSAAVDDAAAAPQVLKQMDSERFPHLKKIWADSKYHNHKLNEWIDKNHPGDWQLEIKSRPADAKGFVLVPKRWVVERTNAWMGRYRRNSKDYERLTRSSESMIRMSAMQTILKKLRPPTNEQVFNYR